MALKLYKMDDTTLPGIADAIRAKTGGTELLLPSEMAEAIAGIPTGGELPELTTPATVGQVLAGKEYIDASGTKKTGTLVVADGLELESITGYDGDGVEVNLQSTADGSEKTLELPEPSLAAENIKSGVNIFGVAGSAKTLRVETGTWTPTEETTVASIPCTAGAKAFCLDADAEVISAVEAQSGTRYVTAVTSNFCGSIAEAPNAAARIWNLTKYANGGLTIENASGISCSLSFYFYAGAYRWAAYYWDD